MRGEIQKQQEREQAKDLQVWRSLQNEMLKQLEREKTRRPRGATSADATLYTGIYLVVLWAALPLAAIEGAFFYVLPEALGLIGLFSLLGVATGIISLAWRPKGREAKRTNAGLILCAVSLVCFAVLIWVMTGGWP